MKFLLVVCFVCCCTIVVAQENGIYFLNGLDWKQVLVKAKAENKYVFVDCFTTWCGPCRYMSNTIFPQAEVASFFNEHFINIKMKFDTSKNDDSLVKARYPDVAFLQKSYSITAYPTFLFFNPEGQLVSKAVGISNTADEFLDIGRASLDTGRQYYTLREKYLRGDRRPEVVSQLVPLALKAGDRETACAAADVFVSKLKAPFSKEDLETVRAATISTKNKGFELLLRNAREVDSILGIRSAAEYTVSAILDYEIVEPMSAGVSRKIDWKLMNRRLRKAAPSMGDAIFTKARLDYYQKKQMWSNFQIELVNYLNRYGDKMNLYYMNNYLWTGFVHSSNKEVLRFLLSWSKKTLYDEDGLPYEAAIDTYANLLYKLGERAEAMEWERKAIARAALLKDFQSQKEDQQTLEKMELNKPTW